LSRTKYSRLVVPRKAHDETVLGTLSLHFPLGFLEEGRNLVACFRDADSARRASVALTARGIRSELVTDIPEGDPLETFRSLSRPFAVGRRFWIDSGDPSDSEPPADRIPLRLPASRAFGTGEHASTRLALLAMEEESLRGARVLDVGTGSAVLALAAAALGAERTFGCDIDFEAILVARENLARNPGGDRVFLMAGAPSAVGGDFALVVANLLPEELLPMRAALLGRVARGGRLIVSGVPRERESEMLERLRPRRWQLVSSRIEEEWSCFCLRRG
jgi:ribosomal protein L11 methyltransferase